MMKPGDPGITEVSTDDGEGAQPAVDQNHRPERAVALMAKVPVKCPAESHRCKNRGRDLASCAVAQEADLFTDEIDNHRQRKNEQNNGVESGWPVTPDE